jgi:Oxygenase domain of the 2OGFeDO superfamily
MPQTTRAPQTWVFHCDTQLRDSEVAQLGTVMDETFYDRLVRASDYNCQPHDAILVYKPGKERHLNLRDKTAPDPDEKLLLCLIHKAIPENLCEEMIPILRTVARSNIAGGNRPDAAGIERVPQYKKDGTRGKYRAVPMLGDPLLGEEDRARIAGAKDGTVGYHGAGVRAGQPLPCRLTYWSKQNQEETQLLMPLVKRVNQAFRRYASKEFDNQLGAAIKSRPWLLGDPNFYSVFTTITVNRSWQTAAHVDKGDLKQGLGVLACFGDFEGSYLIFPKFRTAVEFKQGDILLADVGHEVHGNTELRFSDGRPADEHNKPERLSTIYYFEEKIQTCPN